MSSIKSHEIFNEKTFLSDDTSKQLRDDQSSEDDESSSDDSSSDDENEEPPKQSMSETAQEWTISTKEEEVSKKEEDDDDNVSVDEQAPITDKKFDDFDVLAELCSNEPYNGPRSMTLLVIAFRLGKANTEKLQFVALGMTFQIYMRLPNKYL